MPGLTLVRVHEPNAVSEILEAAESIATGMELEGAEWISAFEKAVDLLAARIPIVPQEPLGFDLSQLNRHGR